MLDQLARLDDDGSSDNTKPSKAAPPAARARPLLDFARGDVDEDGAEEIEEFAGHGLASGSVAAPGSRRRLLQLLLGPGPAAPSVTGPGPATPSETGRGPATGSVDGPGPAPRPEAGRSLVVPGPRRRPVRQCLGWLLWGFGCVLLGVAVLVVALGLNMQTEPATRAAFSESVGRSRAYKRALETFEVRKLPAGYNCRGFVWIGAARVSALFDTGATRNSIDKGYLRLSSRMAARVMRF